MYVYLTGSVGLFVPFNPLVCISGVRTELRLQREKCLIVTEVVRKPHTFIYACFLIVTCVMTGVRCVWGPSSNVKRLII